MRKAYIVPTIDIIAFDPQSLLSASTESLTYTNQEAKKEFEVLSQKKQSWEHTWE
jgi:hypothetical protein